MNCSLFIASTRAMCYYIKKN